MFIKTLLVVLYSKRKMVVFYVQSFAFFLSHLYQFAGVNDLLFDTTVAQFWHLGLF